MLISPEPPTVFHPAFGVPLFQNEPAASLLATKCEQQVEPEVERQVGQWPGKVTTWDVFEEHACQEARKP
ncbi:hypothetical protein MRX96_001184 [Rhipicephalus microplus]